MNSIRLILVAFAGVLLGCVSENEPENLPVTVCEADTLSPDDLGIGKYVFEAKVPAGKVMVLRCTEERNGRKVNEGLESIQYSNGGLAREVVLVYDQFQFPFADRGKKEVRIRAMAGDAHFANRRCASRAISPGRLTLKITGEDKELVILTYECTIEDYETAKKRVPDLPAMSPDVTWTFNAIIRDE